MFRLNDSVRSKKTGKCGVIQATYENPEEYLVFTGNGYEHLAQDDMEHVEDGVVPFRVDLHRVSAT